MLRRSVKVTGLIPVDKLPVTIMEEMWFKEGKTGEKASEK
jgi:hypothetical protein